MNKQSIVKPFWYTVCAEAFHPKTIKVPRTVYVVDMASSENICSLVPEYGKISEVPLIRRLVWTFLILYNKEDLMFALTM